MPNGAVGHIRVNKNVETLLCSLHATRHVIHTTKSFYLYKFIKEKFAQEVAFLGLKSRPSK
jgi:hypothetical protein